MNNTDDDFLEKSDIFIISAYNFFTRPTGILILIMIGFFIFFLNAIISILNNIRRTIMWFYNLKGGNILIFFTILFIFTSGWDNTKNTFFSILDNNGAIEYYHYVKSYIWNVIEYTKRNNITEEF
jgi:hypothetical protein